MVQLAHPLVESTQPGDLHSCYLLLLPVAGSGHEKVTRATLKSALERLLTKSTYIILDSLNNIKVSCNAP